MSEYKILISGSYNVFDSGWDSCGVYMCSGLYQSETFKLPIYIGSSVNLSNRIQSYHISKLNQNKHPDNKILQYSWLKHGKDNFVWWLLESCDRDKTLETEQKYLDSYRSFSDEFGGFNINHDASGRIGMKHSEETRKMISESNMGKKHTEESKKQMSETRKQMFESGELIHPQLGKKYTEEEKRKMSKARIGIPNIQSRKPVLCIETGITYDCIKEAEKILNIKNIGSACIGIYKTAGGFRWQYANEKDKLNNKYIRPPVNIIKGEQKSVSKLKEYQVIEIRNKYSTGQYTYHKLANEYKVSKTTIKNIIKKIKWTHI